MKNFQIWKDDYESRIEIISGDLSKPRFGLDEFKFKQLAAEISCIYHCGAWVNGAFDYLALKPINVNGKQFMYFLNLRHYRGIAIGINGKLKTSSLHFNDERFH